MTLNQISPMPSISASKRRGSGCFSQSEKQFAGQSYSDNVTCTYIYCALIAAAATPQNLIAFSLLPRVPLKLLGTHAAGFVS